MAIEDAAADLAAHLRTWASRARESADLDSDLVDQVEEQALAVLARLGEYLELVGRTVPVRDASIELDELPALFDDADFLEEVADLEVEQTEHLLDLSMIEENLVELIESIDFPDALEVYVERTAALLAM